MTRLILLIIFILCANVNIYSQSWQWVRSVEKNNFSSSLDVVVDEKGNTFVSGFFMDSVKIGNNHFTTPPGLSSCFFVRYNKKGEVIWAISEGEGKSINSSIYPVSIDVDHEDNVYISGHFYEGARFGGVLYETSGSTDCFLLKLNKDGFIEWVKTGGSDTNYNYESFTNVKVDKDGNIVTVGFFQTTQAKFGDITLDPTGEVNGVIIKYSPSGNVLMGKTFDISLASIPFFEVNTLDIDSSNNYYISGRFNGTIKFDHITLVSGQEDIFVAKLNSSGKVLWVIQEGGPTSHDLVNNIVVTENTFYITGYFQGASTTIGGNSFNGVEGLANIFTGDFIASYDTSGNCQWSKIIHYPASTTSFIQNFSFTTDLHKNIYTYVTFNEAVNLIDTLLTSKGSYDIFIAKYDSNGTFHGVNSYGNIGTEFALGIDIDTCRNLYLTGIFNDSLKLSEEEIQGGDVSFFIGRYRPYSICEVCSEITLGKDLFICTENKSEILLSPNKEYDSYLWSTGSTESEIIINSDEITNGTFWVTGFSLECLPSRDSIIISNTALSDIFIPNLVTYDGNNQNDLLEIVAPAHTKINISIFNRWGNLIYASKEYKNDFIPVEIPAGLYFYEVTENECNFNYNGWIHIVK